MTTEPPAPEAPAPADGQPVFRLVRKDPPTRAELANRGLAATLAPLLADVDEHWWSVAACEDYQAASELAGRCRKAGLAGWKFRAAGAEVFARRAPTGERG